MRRQFIRLLLGATLVVFVSPIECAFLYCERHSFNPPICDELFSPG